jgi:hypothetical protein
MKRVGLKPKGGDIPNVKRPRDEEVAKSSLAFWDQCPHTWALSKNKTNFIMNLNIRISHCIGGGVFLCLLLQSARHLTLVRGWIL